MRTCFFLCLFCSCWIDQTPPPRELKVSDPKVKDCTLLQLQLVPTAALHLKFLYEVLNREELALPVWESFLMLVLI
jgi:tether containing UBX domain for GLUT4